VIIILADDLGWGDVGYHGSVIATPNIDRLVSQGIELDRYYTAPISSPTRAGIMTGRYPSRFGFREVVLPPWRKDGLDTGERTIADVLGENGYPNRAMIGKWHLGHSRRAYYPLERGFTHFYGHLNGAIDYFTHERDGELDWHRNWESSYDRGYSTDLLADEAVRCVEEYSDDDPYFLYVAFNAPHSPYQAPEDEIAKHIDIAKFNAIENNRERNGWIYRAMVTRMDAGIGRILDAVERSGERDNTFILFMSDNGGVANLGKGSTNAPLRGHKFQEWDGGVRVAAAVSWPEGFGQGGRKVEQVTGFVDILPTLADIIGVKKAPVRPYDGISVYSVLNGEKDHIERDLYLGVGAVVNRYWKFIRAGRSRQMGLEADYLVDYARDEFEKRNSMDGNEAVAARMRSIAIEYDAIIPAVPEVPYEFGMEGFVSPKEWRVTEP
jgi:arylsulfatase B